MSESPQEASLAPAPESETSPASDPAAESHPEAPHPIQPPQFPAYSQPEPQPPRIPHLGHVLVLALLGVVGFIGSSLLTRSALHFHLWGVSTIQAAIADVHYTIASMAALYLITAIGAALIFPVLWQKSLASGLQWNAYGAMRRITPLLGASGLCFILAMADEALLPGPTNAPIDKLFNNSTAAWLLFAFGITFAPFFEEIIYRGFLLPALCTAFDWIEEYLASETHWSRPAGLGSFVAVGVSAAVYVEEIYGRHRLGSRLLLFAVILFFLGVTCAWLYERYQAVGAARRRRPLDYFGHPQWSLAAMVFASVATSVPFALMHAEQTGWSLGPFLLLVVVSLILCWARLSTRSLAASVIVHASYNFLLFFLMLVGTHGFKHMDKM